MKRSLSRLEKVPQRDAWKHESGDFTPWLAESFRPEHAAALQFLNENTTEELRFFVTRVILDKAT
jgi:hypothetical protein